MRELYSPDSEPELSLLKSVLEEAEVRYFVHNEAFGSLLAGPQIALYNSKTIYVHDHDYDEARDLLFEYLDKTRTARRRSRHRAYKLRDKLRMLLEFLVFGWFLPGRRHERGPRLRLVKGAADRPEPPDA